MQRIMKSKCANDLTLIRLGESKQIKVLWAINQEEW
jgi:hypothetical protein